MAVTMTIIIDRGNQQMATSFLVWGKFKAYPQTDGDGVFVGEVAIEPSETSVSYDWSAPNNNSGWKFIAAPKRFEQVGVFGQLESV